MNHKIEVTNILLFFTINIFPIWLFPRIFSWYNDVVLPIFSVIKKQMTLGRYPPKTQARLNTRIGLHEKLRHFCFCGI